MKTTAKIEAFFYQVESGKAMNMDKRIYLMLKERPMTIEQLRQFQFKHQTLTSSLNRLEQLGLIYKKDTIKGKQFSYSLWDVAKTIKEVEQNHINIFKRDFERWKKVGEKNGYFQLL